jgi:PIN domain nuclease of toxin-antitoxin system
MRLLLDTQCWLWMAANPERLTAKTRSLLESMEHELWLSAVSSWEIAIKHARGKLELPQPPAEYVPSRMERTGVRGLPIEHAHALGVASLPRHHGDPFDRLLVAQAMLEGMTILTADPEIARYEVETIGA